ncbi:MAG: UDP-N-acetylglucosamine 2-epimerase (non-hydrolyzing) [Candidatus Lokiarchaeota archaeon]|nr:UDP-N-acetylglucosamine 2-epimerase (non-hydrolyzing) [Candidatus Lokiarchaeota archaeon]
MRSRKESRFVNPLKPFIVVGTRPEIVKMAPIAHEYERRGISFVLLHTGQHYSKFMSKSFFEDMGLREPNVNLEIGSGSHSEQTAKALVGIEKELLKYKPDIVLVQGDTNAVLSATLAAVKLNIPVGHVEAGLRSYDQRMPEEHNRRLTDHASSYLFAPTEKSAEILRKENVWGSIHITGNTVIDALESRIPLVKKRSNPIEKYDLEEYILLTLHRAENVDDQKILTKLIEGLITLDEPILFPAHPRTVSRLEQFDLVDRIEKCGKIKIIQPVAYLDFLRLILDSKFILTDSGGIQEEATAPSINKRVFVLRTSTERPEAIESGHATLVGVNPSKFVPTIKDAISEGLEESRISPYGDGKAAKRIVDILEN